MVHNVAPESTQKKIAVAGRVDHQLSAEKKATSDSEHMISSTGSTIPKQQLTVDQRTSVPNGSNAEQSKLERLARFLARQHRTRRVRFAEGTISPRKMTRSRLTAQDRRIRGEIDEPRIIVLRPRKAAVDEKKEDKNC